MNFDTWFTQLVEDYKWAEPAQMHHRPETFKSIAHKVYMECVATGFKPITECRRHVYNIVSKTPGDNKKVNWREAEKEDKEENWKPASKEYSDKCVAQIKEIIAKSPMVNGMPRVTHKQKIEEGDWLPKKHVPYPQTTIQEAYVRQRHLDYVKKCYEPRTGAKLLEWIPEEDFNLTYPDINTMNFLTKAKEILSPRDLKLINVDDLETSYKGIQKRIRLYRDELQYSNDKEFIRAKEKRIEMLKIISEELRMLIDSFSR